MSTLDLRNQITHVRMRLCAGHSYESNVVRSAKRVAYFGQVHRSCIRKSAFYFMCCKPLIMMSYQYV